MAEERTAFLEYVGLSGDDERWVRVTYCGPEIDNEMLTALGSYVARQCQRRTPVALALTKLPRFDPEWPEQLQRAWLKSVAKIVAHLPTDSMASNEAATLVATFDTMIQSLSEARAKVASEAESNGTPQAEQSRADSRGGQ